MSCQIILIPTKPIAGILHHEYIPAMGFSWWLADLSPRVIEGPIEGLEGGPSTRTFRGSFRPVT